MIRLNALLLFVLIVFNVRQTDAQRLIPIGTWRVHASWKSIVDVEVSDAHVFAASPTGVMIVDKQELSVTTLTREDGLHGSSITTIAYHQATDQIIVVYDDGTFDVVKGKSVEKFDPAATTVITGSKTINDITIENSIAYLSTDYGVLLFDLQVSEIKETWRDIGVDGETLPVFQCAFMQDSIFLATSAGVVAGDLDDNLLDFTKWKRWDVNGTASAASSIVTFNSELMTLIPGDGVYRYENYAWVKQPYLSGANVLRMTASADNLIIPIGDEISLVDVNGNVTTLTNEKFRDVSIVVEDAGKQWIGDRGSGLVLFSGNTAQTFAANGPASSTGYRLRYQGKKMYMVHGGPTNVFAPARRTGQVSVFDNGIWTILDKTVPDITDVAIPEPGKEFYSSFGYGVSEVSASGEKIYDESNSSLINVNAPQRYVNVSSMLFLNGDLWVTNYGVSAPLHRLSPQGNWDAFTFLTPAAQYPIDMEKDWSGKIWMRINPQQGGGLSVYDPGSGESRYLTEADGNGELPSRNVYALEEDRDGYVWVGTDRGAAYFYDAGSDVVRPIVGRIYLLIDDRVTAIETDGGNRKWMGTQRGAWLFNPSGEESEAHFTTLNSPLPSDNIVDIEIDQTTGEVFFLTDKGLVSFRSDASSSGARFSSVKIFPNPVRANFSGSVGISGLATDAMVKITDVTGKMVWQSQAHGGSLSWSVRSANGKRVSNGIYLVFAASPDGTESVVGKVAVID